MNTKFKVWDINKKVYIPNDVYGIITTDFNAFGVMLKDWEDYREGEYMYHEFQTLIQYTGLKDKAGKEIYEGDIVFNGHGNYKIEFSAPSFGTRTSEGFITYSTAWEIVGNIYQSPELLPH